MGALLLTRRVGEKIMIGKGIEVIVYGVKGNQVRLAIVAPKDVEVHREEIYERIYGKHDVEGGASVDTPYPIHCHL